MENGSFIENFKGVPDEAVRALKAMPLRAEQVDDGVTRHSGHDRGVNFRFFRDTVYNEFKTKKQKCAHYDTFHMIEWMPDRFNRPTERVTMLPPELLEFDHDGVVIGGRYQEEYDRYQKGLEAPGLSLAKWGVLSDAAVATLNHDKIFSVEQFAALPRAKVEGKYFEEIVGAFEQAIYWVKSQPTREQHLAQSSELAALREALEAAQSQINALTAGPELAEEEDEEFSDEEEEPGEDFDADDLEEEDDELEADGGEDFDDEKEPARPVRKTAKAKPAVETRRSRARAQRKTDRAAVRRNGGKVK